MHKARPFLSCQRQREFLTQCVLSYLPLCSTGRSLEPIPPSKTTHTAKWSRCSQMNSCLSWWWELISLANLAIFQMHSSKGYSNQKLYSCKSLLVAARHMLNQPAATRASSSLPGLQQTAGSAVLNITAMFKLDSCQWAHTRNLLFFKCTSHQKPHFH